MKKILISGVVVVVLVLAWIFLPEPPVSSDYKNISYTIDGKIVALVDGFSETEAAPGSSSKITTAYFGNEVFEDFDGDGDQDVAFLITQNTGGSGTFYYVVVALKTAEGYVGTNAVLLGDRIAPQTTEFRDGELIVNFADRAVNEPMSASPSVGVSKHFVLNDRELIEIAK